MEESLRKLIEEAKAMNDEALVAQLTVSLNTYLEKQKKSEDLKLKSQENINQETNEKTEEKKDEVIQQEQEEKEDNENKTKEEEIKKVASGEVSKLTITNSGNHILESKYMDIKPDTKNNSLRINLESILFTLALDDVTKEKKATKKVLDVMKKYNTNEDLEDIFNFIDDVAAVGNVGLELKQSIDAFLDEDVNTNNNPISNSFDDEYENLNKNLSFMDMELDELSNRSGKDPNNYEELMDRYIGLLNKLEALYDESFGKVDSNKLQELSNTINYIKEKINNIKKYHQNLKDLANYADKFDRL